MEEEKVFLFLFSHQGGDGRETKEREIRKSVDFSFEFQIKG
jgi:hypothetical protein